MSNDAKDATNAKDVAYDADYAAAWLKFAESGKDKPRLEHIVPYIGKVFDALPPAPAVPRVLDVGCGWGMALDILAEKRPDATYVGIDPTSGFLDHIVEKYEGQEYGNRIALLQGSLPGLLPVTDEHFDLVLCSMTLHCVGELDRAVATLFRKAKERVVIVDFADTAEKLLRASFEPGYVDNGHYLSGTYNLAQGIQVHAEAFVKNENKLARQIGYHADFTKTQLGELFVGYDCMKRKSKQEKTVEQ